MNKEIDYTSYDIEILKICRNDFQFAQSLYGQAGYEAFMARESIIYKELFSKEISDEKELLKLLTNNYIEGYPNDGNVFVESRKTLFEGLSTCDHVQVKIQDILNLSPVTNSALSTLLNRFRRIYLMRRLLFFGHLDASIAVLESDKNNLINRKDDFYTKYIDAVLNNQDYLFIDLFANETLKNTQFAMDSLRVGDKNLNTPEHVIKLQRTQQEILKNLQDKDSAISALSKKIEDLHQKSNALDSENIKESLSKKWTEGAFKSDKKKARKALNDNALEVAKSLSEEIGGGFTNLILGKSPSIKDADFWKHAGNSIGPMVFGVLGTALGGPLVGGLLGGIGKSIFGAIFGSEPDPVMEKLEALENKMDDLKEEIKAGLKSIKDQLDRQFSVVDGKLDELSADLKNVYSEIKSQIEDLTFYINEKFKDLQNFGSIITHIQNTALELNKQFDIVERYYGEILFKTNIDGLSKIEQEVNNLVGLEEKVLTIYQSTVKMLYNSNYRFSATQLNIPDSPDDDSLVQKIINAHTSEASRFNDTIDYLLIPFNVVDNLYRIYYKKRSSLFACLSALFIFHREKINGVSDVLDNLLSMGEAQDRVNAGLLLHPTLLKANSIGAQNIEFYNFIHSYWDSGTSNVLQAFSLKDALRYEEETSGWFRIDEGRPKTEMAPPHSNYSITRFFIVPDKKAPNSPFSLIYWAPTFSHYPEMKIELQICLGKDDTLTLFEGNRQFFSSLRFGYRIMNDDEWDSKIQRGERPELFAGRFAFSRSGERDRVEYSINSNMKIKSLPQLELTIVPDEVNHSQDTVCIRRAGNNSEVVATFKVDFYKAFSVWEPRARESIKRLSINYATGADEVSVWYSFHEKHEDEFISFTDDLLIGTIKVDKLLAGFH